MTEICRGCGSEVVTNAAWVVKQPNGEHLHLECWVKVQAARETEESAAVREFVVQAASPFLRARSAAV